MVKLKELEAKNEPNQRRLDCKYHFRWRSCQYCPVTSENYRRSATRKWPRHRDLLIDIPASTNHFQEHCVAFQRLVDPCDHQGFVNFFNYKLTFRGKKLVLRLALTLPKKCPKPISRQPSLGGTQNRNTS